MPLIQTPTNQQRHTNIAVVRSKTKPKFELACYKNKVIDYRNGIEKDLENVLQTEEIFLKVAEGTVAKNKDLKKVFGTSDKKEIAVEILMHGELQVSEKERKLMYESMFRDILNFVVNQCLNPDTKRPYTAGIIEREMKNVHFAVKPNKSTKVQALKLIKKLEKKLPIVRAKMRLKLVMESRMGNKLKKWMKRFDEDEYTIEKEHYTPEDKTIMFHVLIDPGMFRKVDEWVVQRASGIAEVIDPCVQEMGEKAIEEYSASEQQHHTSNVMEISDEESHEKAMPKKDARKSRQARKRQDDNAAFKENDLDAHSNEAEDSNHGDDEIEVDTMKPKKGKRAKAPKPEHEIPNDSISNPVEDAFNDDEKELLNTTRELTKSEKRKLRKLKKKKKKLMLDALE